MSEIIPVMRFKEAEIEKKILQRRMIQELHFLRGLFSETSQSGNVPSSLEDNYAQLFNRLRDLYYQLFGVKPVLPPEPYKLTKDDREKVSLWLDSAKSLAILAEKAIEKHGAFKPVDNKDWFLEP